MLLAPTVLVGFSTSTGLSRGFVRLGDWRKVGEAGQAGVPVLGAIRQQLGTAFGKVGQPAVCLRHVVPLCCFAHRTSARRLVAARVDATDTREPQPGVSLPAVHEGQKLTPSWPSWSPNAAHRLWSTTVGSYPQHRRGLAR